MQRNSILRSSICALTLLFVAVPVVAQTSSDRATYTIAQAPYFTTQKQLEQKFRQVKKGWTRVQVERLLGKPQWGTGGIYNYFIQDAKGNSVGEEKALEFDSNGVVVRIGGGAG